MLSKSKIYTLHAWRDNNIRLKATQGEGGVKIAQFKLEDDSGAVDLTTATSVTFEGIKRNGQGCCVTCNIVDAKNGIIDFVEQTGITDIDGNVNGTINVVFPDGNIKFDGIILYVAPNNTTKLIEASQAFSALTEALNKLSVITPEGVIAIDDILTDDGVNPVQGKAIKKVVNNLIESINGKVEYETTKNLLVIPNLQTKQNGIVVSTNNNHISIQGTATANSTIVIPISFQADGEYTFSIQNITDIEKNVAITLWGNKSVICNLSTMQNLKSQTFNSSELIDELKIWVGSGTDVNKECDIQLESGQSYTEFVKPLAIPNTYSTVQVDSLLSEKADKSETYFDSKPVFIDFELGEMQSGYISNTGVGTEHSTFEHTEVIPCEEGDEFKVTATYGFYAPLAVFYDGEGKFIGYDENHYYPSGSKTATAAVITVISGAKGIAFNNRPQTTTISVQKRYTEKIPVKVKIAELEKNTANPLAGKTMYADGDSVAEGEGNNKKSYADMIAEKYGMSLVKKAVGGTNLAMGNDRANSIYERVTAMTGTYDYILLEGGFNDVFNSVPLGKLTTGYFNDYDPTTVIGAVEGICEFLVTNHFESKKLFILGHRKFGAHAGAQELVWNGIISALEKWGIPYVDISKETHLSAWNTEIANKYFKYDNILGQGDGTHPNQAGYEEFYVPLIESKLKSL